MFLCYFTHTGLIQVSNSLRDHVGLHRLTVSVVARDVVKPDVVNVAQLQVVVKVDIQEPYFAVKMFKFVVPEDAPGRTTAGALQVWPQHSGVKFLIQPPGSQAFEVDADSGVIRTKIGLDREAKAWHVFNVIAQYADSIGQDTAQVILFFATFP